ncbi:hypothetical protein ACFSQ7_09970 [Paenibacillus rhizoplanae]
MTKELLNLNRRVDGVYSSFFVLEDSDYVFSTDSSITTLARYEPIGWITEALKGRRGGLAGCGCHVSLRRARTLYLMCIPSTACPPPPGE